MESRAIHDINIEIKDGEILGLIGHTGSGKSTLVQHLNGLLFATQGSVAVDGIVLKKGVALKEIRKRVGLVFQYPEHQLFEETVFNDIAFGPRNLHLDEDEISIRVRQAMDMVHMDYYKYKDLSPFDLSGGQMRRVALAGVLAMRPKTLILDEPTAGLDPFSRDEIIGEIIDLHRQHQMTLVIVSHSMEEVARIVQRLIVLKDGTVFKEGVPREVFRYRQELRDAGLGIPQVTNLMQQLHARYPHISPDALTVAEAKEEIMRNLQQGGDRC
jgi:energy-coupling factor transport system ATP-binding protein